MDLYAAIGEFHEKFGLTRISDENWMLPQDVAVFRVSFMAEEVQEYVAASNAGDAAEVLDALVDLVYVALGTAYLHGFDFNEAFKRVHEANLLKTRAQHSGESKRGSVYDVVKPIGWIPPDLSDLVPVRK